MNVAAKPSPIGDSDSKTVGQDVPSAASIRGSCVRHVRSSMGRASRIRKRLAQIDRIERDLANNPDAKLPEEQIEKLERKHSLQIELAHVLAKLTVITTSSKKASPSAATSSRKDNYNIFKQALCFVISCIFAHSAHAGHINATQTTTQATDGTIWTRWLFASIVIGGMVAGWIVVRRLLKRRNPEYKTILVQSKGEQDVAGTNDDLADLTKLLMPIAMGAGIGTVDIGSDFGIALPTLYASEKNEWAFWVQIFILVVASIGGALNFITEYELWRNVHINAAVKPAIIIGSCIAFPFFPPSVLITAFVAWIFRDKGLMLKCRDALIIISQGEILESLFGFAFQTDLYFRELVKALLFSMICATLSSSYTSVVMSTKKKELLAISLTSKRAEEDDKHISIITGPLEHLTSAPFTVALLGIHYCFELVSGVGCIVLSQYVLHDYFIGPALPIVGFGRYSVAWLAFTGIQAVCFLALARFLVPTTRQQRRFMSVISSMVVAVPLMEPSLQVMPLYGVRIASQVVITVASYTSNVQVNDTSDQGQSLAMLMNITVTASVCMWLTLFILRFFAISKVPLEWREEEMKETAEALHKSARERENWDFAYFRLRAQAGRHPQMQHLIENLMAQIRFASNTTEGEQALHCKVLCGLDAWALLEYLQYLNTDCGEVKVEFDMEFDEVNWFGDMMADERTCKDTLKHYLSLLDPGHSNKVKVEDFQEIVHNVFQGKYDRLCEIIEEYPPSEVKHGALLEVVETAKNLEFKEAVYRKAAEAELSVASTQLGTFALERALLKYSKVPIAKSTHEAECKKRKLAESELEHASLEPGPSALRAALDKHKECHVDKTTYEAECKDREAKAAAEDTEKKAEQDKAEAVKEAKEEARYKELFNTYVKGEKSVEMDDYKGQYGDIDDILKEIAGRYQKIQEIHLGNTSVTDKGLQGWSKAYRLPHRLNFLEHFVDEQALARNQSAQSVTSSSSELTKALVTNPSSSSGEKFNINRKKTSELAEVQELVKCGVLPREVECAENCEKLKFIDLWGCSGITDVGVMELCRAAPFLKKVVPPSRDFNTKDLRTRFPQISFS